MPNIDGKEYPRLENGVIIERPPVQAEKPANQPVASKKKARKKRGASDNG